MRDFHQPGRSAVYATSGMCATSHPLAAAAAIDILKVGGSAADAAIAGAVLLGVCEPQMTGIGGDCFALISPGPDGDVVALNASGRAPAGLDPAALRAAGHGAVPVTGPESVTIPGAIDGFCRLSERFGRLPLSEVLAPAIRYFDEGVPVAPRVAFDWVRDAPVLRGDARRHYLLDGQVPRVGQVFRAPKQAEVLRRIAAEGRDAFYTGAVAADMLAALRAEGGVHTEDDFAAQRADWTDPISAPYAGIEVVEHPPNGQGAAALLMLNILAQFDLAAMDPLGADRVHLEAEATKLAYDARNRFLGDPSRMDPVDRLQDPALGARLAALIDMGRAMGPAAPITEAVHTDTIYITVVDRDRMAVSLIYSIFNGFGSGLASPEYGILLHNRGAGFTLAEGHPNEAGPGRRPMHTIIPGMIRRAGRVETPFGVMGGQYQAAGHARFVTNVEIFGMDAQAALDSPRAFAIDGELRLERGYGEEVRADLAARGHAIVTPETAIGGAQAIRIHPDGVLEGASDPRKDGCALGY